jgi:hypothetical protein
VSIDDAPFKGDGYSYMRNHAQVKPAGFWLHAQPILHRRTHNYFDPGGADICGRRFMRARRILATSVIVASRDRHSIVGVRTDGAGLCRPGRA